MGYLYYPGCSLKGSGAAYEKSLLEVFRLLDEPLEELPDWNCCGATTYMSINERQALAMAARNLAIAESEEKDVVAPCSACYMVLRKTQKYLKECPAYREPILKALKDAGLHLDGMRIRVRHPLDVLVNEIGIQRIQQKVQRKLNGLRVFPYYGCLIVRPKDGFDHPHYPVSLDRLMEALGCEVIDHPLKTRCCGGSLTGTLQNVGLRLSYFILKEAKKRGAHFIVTVCPLCQFNLDVFQGKIEKQFKEKFQLPVVYFTEVLAYALGSDQHQLDLQSHFTPVNEVFEMVR